MTAGQGNNQEKARPGQRRIAQWARDYARLPGIPDEYIGPDGAPRPVWSRFFDAFAALSPAEIERRFASADRHLREAGVTYRAPGETADRLWPLSHLPLLIDDADWRQLTAGIAQRAQLFELVLRDLYGEGRLVAEGAIPAAAIAGSSEYLRAVCGVKPPGGRYLHLYAADVGRGPDGRWWVLNDRTQAPSGAGYALENRLVLSRAFAGLYKSMNVERVAPFFEAFRDALRASADRNEPRIGLLTRVSRRLLGEELQMPHIATWWCGQKSAREEVLSRLDEVAIESAYGHGVPGFPGHGPVLPSQLSAEERERLRGAISERGIDFVGQELVRLSTTPVWENGHLTPRPFVLRVFAAATPNGWTILPGGFCRIAEQADARAVSMGNGARAADVWVVSDKAVSSATLLPAVDTVRIRRIAGVVPSRAADNLFWLGRYLERAEATLRLIRALGAPTRDAAKANSTAATSGASTMHSVERIQRLLVTWGATSQTARANPAKVAAEALQSEERFGSALSLLRSAQRTATSLRERLSPDAWQVITEMVERLGEQVEDDDGVLSAAELSLQELASFAGLAQENMNRAAGWRFLEMGRRAERAINTTRFARQFAFDEAGEEDLDVLLTLVDCQITYRSRYLVGPTLAPVRDLAVLDPYNPRSVAFQVAALNEHIAALPSLKEHGLIERPQRLAVAAQATLTTAEATTLDVKTLFALEQDLLTLADAIGLHYFPHGPNASRPEKLTGLA
jgi:uncharacterized circularly permuted ATP-grasp superfamily protein/uncharacterized alpha-E superfamily protein